MGNYAATISHQSFAKVKAYLSDLKTKEFDSGAYLARAINAVDISSLTPPEFLEILVNTKRPQIFAESAVCGDGRDWTQIELSLLGDVSFIVPVKVFDDGAHRAPLVHDEPFLATLLFTAGALLRNGQGVEPVDWAETHKYGQFDMDGFISLYRRRLVPVLQWVNADALSAGRPALITVPGLGCGQFAGMYQGQLGARLETALKQIFTEIAATLPNIKAVWYDPYNECEPSKDKLGHIDFLTRPLIQDLIPRPQLSASKLFGFEDCALYSFVAWDHVSWPGNDYYIGDRATDDGVKAAATDTMHVMTGTEGVYDARQAKYLPPSGFSNWNEVVKRGAINLEIQDALFIA